MEPVIDKEIDEITEWVHWLVLIAMSPLPPVSKENCAKIVEMAKTGNFYDDWLQELDLEDTEETKSIRFDAVAMLSFFITTLEYYKKS
eukprot:scaffold7775_cov61-Cyclotella_meneghiniana.AAC.7